jgi:hypothetical protein
MPFAEIPQCDNKENVLQQPSRKRRASEGSILKPKAKLASWKISSTKTENQNQGNESHWKQLFMSLQQERVTASERQLYTFMEESEQREDALKNYIRHLESELVEARKSVELSEHQASDMVELQEKLDEKDNQLKVSENSVEAMTGEMEEIKSKTTAQMEDLLNKVEQKDSEIQMYHVLTGTVMTPGVVENSVDCRVTNVVSKVSTLYRLTTLDDNEQFMKFQSLENPDPLPTFLKQDIEFETVDCPGLFQNILKGVFPD